MSADPLKAIRELIERVPHRHAKCKCASCAKKTCPACDLKSALTAAEQEIAQFVSERDNQKKISLAALNMNEANEARANSAEQELREREGQLAAAEKAWQGIDDARVAAAFELAARKADLLAAGIIEGKLMPSCENPLSASTAFTVLADAIRALTPPEATAALEKMLMEARRDALKRFGWKMNNSLNDWQTILQEEGESLDAQIAALTGEKKA